MKPAGLVLAGGLGSRMGGEVAKPQLRLGDRTLFELACEPLRSSCDPLLVGAHEASATFGGLTVVADRRPARLGPLAGLEAAFLTLCAGRNATTHLVCVPADTPFLPRDLVARLGSGDHARVARFEGRLHPSVVCWPLGKLAALSRELDDPHGSRSLKWLLESAGYEPVDFPPDKAAPDGDPFFNVNTPDDLEKARRRTG